MEYDNVLIFIANLRINYLDNSIFNTLYYILDYYNQYFKYSNPNISDLRFVWVRPLHVRRYIFVFERNLKVALVIFTWLITSAICH